jgi:hypothetical protein
MSEVVEVIEPGCGGTPKLRLRCAGCGRLYVSVTHTWNAKRLEHCERCRVPRPRGPRGRFARRQL